MAHNDRQSLQYIPISSSRDLSKSIENLEKFQKIIYFYNILMY